MDSKKKKEVIEVWGELKKKITNSWKEGKVVVYQSNARPQRIIYARDDKLVTKEFQELEKKLDLVRNLIANNNLAKLKQLVKEGKI